MQAKIKIFGAIIGDLTEIDFLGGISSFYSLNDFEKDLKKTQGAESVIVEINSPGGNVDAGISIFHGLRSLGIPVTTVIHNASSIASVIALAGDTRLGVNDLQMVIHNAWYNPTALGDAQLNKFALQDLLDSAVKNDKKILDIYTSVIGSDKQQEIAELMARETNLGFDGAMRLGFITGEYEGKASISNAVAFAYDQSILNIKSKMENEKLTALEKGFKTLMAFFKGSAQNMTVELQDGAKIFVFTEDGEVEGKRAVIADEEGNPTEQNAPEGNHTLRDGRTITVGADGIITSVSESAADALAEKEKEIEALKSQVSAMTEEKEKYAMEKKEIENQFNALALDFDKFKKATPGADDKKSPVNALKVSQEEFQKLPKSKQIQAIYSKKV
jgi:ATP-dependent protease ClpP protease subunit